MFSYASSQGPWLGNQHSVPSWNSCLRWLPSKSNKIFSTGPPIFLNWKRLHAITRLVPNVDSANTLILCETG